MARSLLVVIPFHRLLSVDVTGPCFLAIAATQGELEEFNTTIA